MSRRVMPIRFAFVSFLECELRGFWESIDRSITPRPDEGLLTLSYKPAALSNEIGWSTYKSLRDGSEIALVRPDGLKRFFRFKNEAVVAVGQTMVRFDQQDVIEELSVDENAREGKRPSSTVVGRDKPDKKD